MTGVLTKEELLKVEEMAERYEDEKWVWEKYF
jgi:hypothetical protein